MDFISKISAFGAATNLKYPQFTNWISRTGTRATVQNLRGSVVTTDAGVNYIVACGDTGTIIYSRDSGASWFTNLATGLGSVTYNAITSGFDSIFLSAQILVTVGASGSIRIIRVQNITFASSWSSATSGTSSDLNDVIFGAGVFVAVGNTGAITSSSNNTATSWTLRTSGTTNNLNGIAWNGTTFVAVGASGTVLTSTNGTTWTVQTSGTATNFNKVTWDGTNFVAVGASGAIFVNSNGVGSWTARTSGTSEALNSIASGGSRYSTVGANGTILRSGDGTGWFSITPQFYSPIRNVVWNSVDSSFLAFGDNGLILKSFDSVSWEVISTSLNFFDIAYASSIPVLVAVGANGLVATSSNGDYWSFNRLPSANNYNGITWNGSTFVAVGNSGVVATSTNGTAWTARTSGVSNTLNRVAWNGTVFATCGSPASGGGTVPVLHSTNGITWTLTSFSTFTSNENLSDISVSGNGSVWVTVGRRPYYSTTTTPATWTGVSVPTDLSAALNSVVWSGTEFVASGSPLYGAVVVTSTNGIAWTTRYDGAQGNSAHGAYSSTLNTFVLPVPNGRVKVSSDNGLSWNWYSVGVSVNNLTSVAWNGSVFAVVGASGSVSTSTDGITWTSRTSGTASTLQDITWNGTVFAACGDSGVVITSTDGTTWNLRTSGVSNNLTTIAWGNNVFLSGGAGKTLIRSTTANGLTWSIIANTNVPLITGTGSSQQKIYKISYTNNEFFVTGENGKIITTANGDTWKYVISGEGIVGYGGVYSDASNITILPSVSSIMTVNNVSGEIHLAPAVLGVRSATFGNGTFVAVSSAVSPVNGAIYSSTNGYNWTIRSQNTSIFLNDVTYGNGLFVAAGLAANAFSSTDGTTWDLRPTGISFPASEGYYNIVYGNGLFVAVGANNTIATTTDSVTWTRQTSPFAAGSLIAAASWTGTQFVAVRGGLPSTSSSISTSTNGITWTTPITISTNSFAVLGITFRNGLYLATGSNSTGIAAKAATSTDGITWTERATNFGSYRLYKSVWDGNRFLVYGGSFDSATGNAAAIFTTTDGITWGTKASHPTLFFSTANIGPITWTGTQYIGFTEQFGSYIFTSTDKLIWSANTATELGIGYTGGTLSLVSNGSSLYVMSTRRGVRTSNTISNLSSFVLRTFPSEGRQITDMVYTNSNYVFVVSQGGVVASPNVSNYTNVVYSNVGFGSSNNAGGFSPNWSVNVNSVVAPNSSVTVGVANNGYIFVNK